MSYIVTANWLKENIHDVVVVDVRFDLFDEQAGVRAYKANHLPGAFYLHLNDDLSSERKKHGGSHPLPDVLTLAKTLGEIGIDEHKTVVFYDANNDMFAARAWWLLHYLGHPRTYLLDGGYNGWIEAGFDVTTKIQTATPVTFQPKPNEALIVSMEDVKKSVKQKNTIFIDSRAFERYTGEVEPLYEKSGHIPGATHYFWKDVLDENGKWKTTKALATHFKGLNKDAEIIVSCGSGVSACPNIIGLKMAGFTNVTLYPGSFSDWISYEENEVIQGEE